jgi:transcriptional regulator with XRE-family HTH domain
MLPIYKIIGQRIKDIRMKKQMTQAALAEKIDMSATYMSHIETGKKRASFESLLLITNALEITMDHLIIGNQTNEPAEYLMNLALLLEDCTEREMRLFYEITFSVKKYLRDN